MLISHQNEIYSTGSNSSHKLGINKQERKHGFHYKINKLTKITSSVNGSTPSLISTGIRNHTHNVIYTDNNDIYGLGDIDRKTNTFHKMDNYFLYQSNDTIMDIKVGQYHTLFLTQNGNVYSMGSNKGKSKLVLCFVSILFSCDLFVASV